MALADLRTKIQRSSSAITKDTRAWLWLRSHVLDDAKLRLSLQNDADAHRGPAGFLTWCGRHNLDKTFSRLDMRSGGSKPARRKVYAFAVKVLSFAAVICAPDADYEVKETAVNAAGLGLFTLRDIELFSSQRLPGLTGWRRSLGDAQPTPSLNSWMSASTASKTADALIGPVCLGNHRCESDLEWAQTRNIANRGEQRIESKLHGASGSGSHNEKKKKTESVVVLRAKAGKPVRLPAGTEIRWNYGQIDFECKCPDEHVHASRKRKRLDAPAAADSQNSEPDGVSLPVAKRLRTRPQTKSAPAAAAASPS
jgi:hypothetical protein